MEQSFKIKSLIVVLVLAYRLAKDEKDFRGSLFVLMNAKKLALFYSSPPPKRRLSAFVYILQ